MKKLNRRLILEVLEDDDVSASEELAEQPEEIHDETTEPAGLDQGEKINFILSVLSDLNNKALDMFNYITPYITTTIETEETLSEDNKALLTSVYEDVSLILGKLSQGLKNNSPENIQNAIDDGQTEAQETISTPDQLEESKTDKSTIRFWAADKDDLDDGELFKTKEEAIEYANSSSRWVRVYKGDFRFLMTPKWDPEIVWTKVDQDKVEENLKTYKENKE